MSAAMPLSTRIDQSASIQRPQRILQAQFGDGYSQELADGLNSRLRKASISWSNLTESELDTVLAALDAVGSTDYLTWTPPGDSSSSKWKVTPDGYTITYPSGSHYSVALQLREVV